MMSIDARKTVRVRVYHVSATMRFGVLINNEQTFHTAGCGCVPTRLIVLQHKATEGEISASFAQDGVYCKPICKLFVRFPTIFQPLFKLCTHTRARTRVIRIICTENSVFFAKVY